MKISIIIATYNASKTLKECLESIVPQLNSETELVVIDGGSKDTTLDIIRSFGDKIAYTVSEPDKGIYDAWNKGVAAAKGKWIGFIGADDILLPGAINAYLKVINSTSGIDAYDYICAHNEYVDFNGKLLKILGEAPRWSKMRNMMVAAHVASLHNKRNLFETIGGYDLQFKICADYDLLLRKKNKLKYIFIESHIARMKVGGMSFSTKAIIEVFKIRKKNKSVNPVLNALLFVRYWLAFKFFILRKTQREVSFSRLISRIKGEEYSVDSSISQIYLIRLLLSKFVSLLYGAIRLRTLKRAFIHPSSTIKSPGKIVFYKNLNIAQGCYIDAMSEQGLICGYNVSMGYNTHIELTGSLHNIGKGMKIGNNVGLGTHGHYGSGLGFVEIGDNTIFGNYVSLHPETHNFTDLCKPIREQGVKSKGGIKIGKDCWIGAKVTILDGTIIGDHCVVAAGAVVTGHFPSGVVIGGIPAKILRNIHE